MVWDGGPVLASPITVRFLWYGSWSAASKAPLQNLVAGLSGSAYWGVLAQYWDASGGRVSQSVALGADASLSANRPGAATTLSDAQVLALIRNAFPSPAAGDIIVFAADRNTLLTVPAGGTEVTGCQNMCGYHLDYTAANGASVTYVGLMHHGYLAGGCAPCRVACDPILDNPLFAELSTASTLAHELVEAATDPFADHLAWQVTIPQPDDQTAVWQRLEVGDPCSLTHTAAPEAPWSDRLVCSGNYNVVLSNGAAYVLQNIWSGLSGACVVQEPLLLNANITARRRT